MADENTPMTPLEPATATYTPIPPIVPLAAWTWNSPVIPQFYWNVYSAEQRIRQICMEIGRIQAYLDYLGAYANRAHGELNKRIDTLTAKLTEEVNRLDKRIDEENAARKEADELLRKGLDAETARAKAAEQVLQTNIDAVQTNLDNEAATRKAADDKLTADLNSEIARAKKAEEANATAIANETTAREDADTALGNRITDEVEDRKNGDTALGNRIDAVDARVTLEVTDRTNADTRLERKIDANTANITVNADAIAAEAARAKEAEGANASAIAANKTASDEADKRIQDSLDTEIANRKNGDNKLTESLTNETNARTEADTALGGRIDAEASNRQTADNLLTQQVNRRVMATNVRAADNSRITVDTATSDTDPDGTTVTIGSTFDADFNTLTGRVDDLSGKLAHETADRESADNTLTEAVNKRLRAEDVIAGEHITVTPDPDATTVTIAATGFATSDDVSTQLAGKLDTVAHDATLVGDGTSSTPLGANIRYYTEEAREQYPLLMKAGQIGLGVASADSPGIVSPDGTTTTVDSDGTLHAVGGLGTITTDDTLIGDGTSENPLHVAGNIVAGSILGTKALQKIATNHTLGGEGTSGIPLSINANVVTDSDTIAPLAMNTTECGVEVNTEHLQVMDNGRLDLSDTVIANSAAGGTALQTVAREYGSGLVGSGTHDNPLDILHGNNAQWGSFKIYNNSLALDNDGVYLPFQFKDVTATITTQETFGAKVRYTMSLSGVDGTNAKSIVSVGNAYNANGDVMTYIGRNPSTPDYYFVGDSGLTGEFIVQINAIWSLSIQ